MPRPPHSHYSQQEMDYLFAIDKRRVVGKYSHPSCHHCRRDSGAIQSIYGGTVRIDRDDEGKPIGGFFILVDWDKEDQPETFTIEGFKRRCQIVMNDIKPFKPPRQQNQLVEARGQATSGTGASTSVAAGGKSKSS